MEYRVHSNLQVDMVELNNIEFTYRYLYLDVEENYLQ